MMERRVFREDLERGAQAAMTMARALLLDRLPEQLRFWIVPPKHWHWRKPAPPGVIKLYDGSLLKQKDLAELSLARVAQLLCGSGRVPLWTKLRVEWTVASYSCLAVVPCPRPTVSDPSHCRIEAIPPLAPPQWHSVDQDGRFSLFWRQEPLSRLCAPRSVHEWETAIGGADEQADAGADEAHGGWKES
jgi:hypothetical protein